MRILLHFVLLVVIFLAGCARNTAGRTDSGPAGWPGTTGEVAGKQNQSTTPSILLVGKVDQVNSTAQFVVLNFPLGRFPALEQPLRLYRNGVKVGAVQVSAWQYDDNVVADIVAGESQVGDEARDR